MVLGDPFIGKYSNQQLVGIGIGYPTSTSREPESQQRLDWALVLVESAGMKPRHEPW